ncbi:MAG: leucyl aminopeptidase, partial [Symbiobacteriaceae bacterium]|nr:leucyl aminopeptidase [Symbiobacteriaceae bacterium]
MQLSYVHGEILETAGCAMIQAVYQEGDQIRLTAGTLACDAKIGGLIQGLIEAGEITGKLNETTVLYPSGLPIGKLVIVGLGKIEEFTMDRLRQVSGTAVKIAAKGKVEKIISALHGVVEGKLCPCKGAQAVAEGTILALTRSDLLQAKPGTTSLKEVVVVESCQDCFKESYPWFNKGIAMAEGTRLARQLTTLPANYMTPTHMSDEAAKIASATGLKLDVLEKDDMLRLGMGCLLGVAQGSAQPPKMIILRHDGDPEHPEDILALVGKGLTFDAGGISLKPGAGMEAMKGDMGGGAAVLGAMQVVGTLKPRRNVIGVVAATENLPDGNAFKPGDVLTGMTGKTIEIISTDAEGRLILADAVAYAEKLGASRIIDAATLTGSSAQAFGGIFATILANCDSFYSDVISAAELSGERFWRMPIVDEYKEMYKSPVADIKNSGARGGGMITGGLIIAEFISKAAWVHLDIAG